MAKSGADGSDFPQYLLEQRLKNANNPEHADYWQQHIAAGLPLMDDATSRLANGDESFYD
ncbi:hypothetical protein XBJ2_410033 [Xenorhabdus bovienii str. Jollieti]|uniref:Uncharacterized protein n=1 Tax=Xenorhabdus bovienii (strain SS-2004) TaxID=406818 RepID=D3UX15_XENBS|nr:hypothetical protein XBJ1_0859 [Xenorhabdus bovienii SS-2004]CDH29720.1 hypothetical protein XBJ2_410033 [Xenorhabdus bovienii str. Jollieti]